MSNSDLPSDDALSLWFSCWPQPSSHSYSELSEEGAEEQDVFEWLAEHVFCDRSSSFWNSDSIHLMDPLVFENVCENFPVNKEIDFSSDTIVWNEPQAEVEQTTLVGVGYDAFNYTIWNVSFPIYRWGGPETQRKVQRSLELKLRNSYISRNPLDGCRLAVVGMESEFWLATRINQEEKDVIQLVGIIFLVVQTIMVLLVPLVGKKLAQRDYRRREEDEHLLCASSNEETHSEGSLDDLLRTSKGYLDTDVPHSSDVEKAVPIGDVEITVDGSNEFGPTSTPISEPTAGPTSLPASRPTSGPTSIPIAAPPSDQSSGPIVRPTTSTTALPPLVPRGLEQEEQRPRGRVGRVRMLAQLYE